MESVGRSHEEAPGREVGRLHDERIPLPMPTRVAVQLTHAFGQMRASIERNHPGLVVDLAEERDVPGPLHDLLMARVVDVAGDLRDTPADAAQNIAQGGRALEWRAWRSSSARRCCAELPRSGEV